VVLRNVVAHVAQPLAANL